MFKYIIWAIVIYCVVRFIFNFLIPVIRTARQMKSQVKDFQDRMGSQQFRENVNEQQPSGQRPSQRPGARPRKEDYIDFEELK